MIQLGKRTAPPDLVASLDECHVRIRRFLELARRIVDTHAPLAELAEAARDVGRYFRQALPQHVGDEHLLAERLAGRDPALDEVLETMRAEHGLHEPVVADLLASCATIERAPERIGDIRTSLAAAVGELERLLVPHLDLEERALFPMLRALDVAEQRRLLAEIRERRERVLAHAT